MWKRKWVLRAEADEGSEGAPPVVEEGASPPDDSNIWDDLLDDEGSEPEVAETPAVEAKAEEVGVEPEKPAATETPEPKPAEVAPAVVEQRVEVVAPPPAQVVSQPQMPPPPTPEQVAAFRQRMLDAVAEQYALQEDDASAFQVEPEKVLPKLAARLHANIYDHIMRDLARQAPQVVERQLHQRQAVQAAEDAFYSRWDELRPHAAQVQQVAQMWRQMYPQATMQEAIEGVGQATKALLGITTQGASEAAAAPRTPPPTPARPAARGAPAPRAKPMSAEEQAFADLAKSFEEEY
jgi:hypothetical protein